MDRISRRDFLKTGIAAGAAAGIGSSPLRAARATASDWVTLGKSGVKVTRLALGTGTNNGAVQRQLGQEAFTRLVRHAYDRGIRFFETADSYPGMHQMLGIALKGLPRESYVFMTKVTTDRGDPQARVDQLRKMAQTEYFDIMLLHCMDSAAWPHDTERWQDGILQMEHRHAVVSHGASIHGLPALRQVPGNKWLNVALLRVNHRGAKMDSERNDWFATGNVSEVARHAQEARTAGMGLIGMKLVGAGEFTGHADRQQAMQYAFKTAGVQSVTVGYKSTAEIDEAIDNLNLALA